MPFGIQPIHLVIVAVVALIVFGPSRLPEIGRGVGKALTEFRRGFREMSENVMEEANKQETSNPVSDTLPAHQKAPASSRTYACPQCGAINPVEARFCNSCGIRLSES